jgi:hypothetical protein
MLYLPLKGAGSGYIVLDERRLISAKISTINDGYRRIVFNGDF